MQEWGPPMKVSRFDHMPGMADTASGGWIQRSGLRSNSKTRSTMDNEKWRT